MFRLDCLLATIILLSSSTTLFGVEKPETVKRDIEFGIADIQIATIDNEKSILTPGIVVRITGQKNHVLSYGMTNEGGNVSMPLPPGRYCYELFDDKGKSLQTSRKGQRRCFDIEKDAVETVGIEFMRK